MLFVVFYNLPYRILHLKGDYKIDQHKHKHSRYQAVSL